MFCVEQPIQDLYSCVVWKVKINTWSAKFHEPFRLPHVLEFLYYAAFQEHTLCICTWLNDVLFFYVLLTVHLSIILLNDQLDARFFFRICLFQISACFEHSRAHHQEN